MSRAVAMLIVAEELYLQNYTNTGRARGRIAREGRQLRSDVLLVKLQKIQSESARYNLGPVTRTINIPIMALLFLEKANQQNLTFKQGKAGNVKRFTELAAAADIRLIEFNEKGPGTMVTGANNRDIPSQGRVWLEHTTGRILRTELITQDMQLRALVDVSYKATPGLDFLVPGEMRETYLLRQTEIRIDGKATYDRFRQFSVSTTEKPKSNDF